MQALILNGILSRMRFKGWTFQDLADAMHKDVSTVKKQLSEQYFSHLNISTLMEYLEVLGGRLVYETEEALATIENSDINELRSTINVLGARNDELHDRIKDKDESIKNLQERNDKLQIKLDTVIDTNARLSDALCHVTKKAADKFCI